MKVVILAGGLGTRLTEETETRPKPMVEIGGRPILWHIMKLYAHHGFREFVVALGYKGDVIKRYFLDYAKLQSNFTVNLGSGDVMRRGGQVEDWTVHLVDTGSRHQHRRPAQAAGADPRPRDVHGDLRRRRRRTSTSPPWSQFHRGHGKLATVTAVRPPARFGGLVFDGDRIAEFTEKPQIGEGWINGGFFVLEPDVLDYIADDQTSWEREPLERLAARGAAHGLSPRGLLAVHGHPPRPPAPRGPLDQRQGPVESLGGLSFPPRGRSSRLPRGADGRRPASIGRSHRKNFVARDPVASDLLLFGPGVPHRTNPPASVSSRLFR